MAVILLVESKATDRRLLAAVLRRQGHQTIHVSDGREALQTLTRIRPDVVMSNILMPTGDGCELVHRMRETVPAVAATPVIFFAPAFHVGEVRRLAQGCGVFDIVARPSPPQALLASLNAALRSPVQAQGDRDEHNRQPSVTPELAAGMDPSNAETERLKAVLDVARQLTAQRNPFTVLNKVCSEARYLTLAQRSVVGLLPKTGSTERAVYTCGLDTTDDAGRTLPFATGPLLGAVGRKPGPMRVCNPTGQPELLGLPAAHPTVFSLLTVPIASSTDAYGWLSLQNKLGADGFTEIDEWIATTLGALAAVAYESSRMRGDLRRHVAEVGQEFRAAAFVREEERSALSRQLHDEMGQLLTGLKIEAHWLATYLLKAPAPAKPDIARKFDDLLLHLDETIQSVRTIAQKLRPDVLDKLGLIAAIESQAEECTSRSGIQCRVKAHIDPIKLDPAQELTAFRIAQEALTNVVQHSHATRATVRLRRSVRWLTVSIEDNGRGVAARNPTNRRSLGLIGMRERAELIGGRLDVRGGKPTGTIVTLKIPLVGRPAIPMEHRRD